MSSISNYPCGFANGINVRGMPLLSSYPGQVFWVDSVNGSDGNKGTFDRPFASIDYAVGRCTANRGDIIVAKAGHSETVTAAGGIALDVAGIALVGLGTGSLRPTINFTTAVGADINIDAANITIVNFLFTGGIDALTGPIDINAADFAMINCETRDVTGQATVFIVTDNNSDRFLVSGWRHIGASAAGATCAIRVVGGADWVIENFNIYGNFSAAAIENLTTASSRVRIGGGSEQCYIWTENAADVAVTMQATATGHIGPNINAMLQDNAANITEAFVGAACQFFQPINIVNLAGESSMQTNITASTDA